MLRKLEKYLVEEEIGHGGMATVYRARDTVLDRRVALKVLHPHLRAAVEARRRFQREARSVARLRHPRVLEIYDFSGESSEEAYIAAELLTGPTLKQWREKQRSVPAEIAACFVIEVARALEAAHEAGIVHRDVKPENVLLHEARMLKLTDFGIADMVDAQSMTATGQILGSPGHMAPEQIEGKDTDKRTDLFSLGTVLYYLATGRLPFTGRNPHQVLKRIVDGEYADPLRVNPTIGGGLRRIIQKSLERDLEHRYQSAKELREDLEAFIAEAGIDDAEEMLERFLQDPEKVGAEVEAAAVERSIKLGMRASDAGDVPAALDYYNRVLALDEGNEKVLKLIEKVGIDRRRRMLVRVGAMMTGLGLLAGGGAWALWSGTLSSGDPGAGARVTSDFRAAASERDADLDGSVDGTAIATNLDAGTDEPVEAEMQAEAMLDAGAAAPADVNDAPTQGRVRRWRPRPVRLVSVFNNMRVRVLDRQGQEVVPQRPIAQNRVLQLAPGRYWFELEPGAESVREYRRTRQTVEVAPGTGEQEVRLRLELAPAQLYVRSNVPGRVVVGRGGGRVTGRTGTVVSIPMQSAEELLPVRVTAEGHEAAETTHTFIAGGNTVEIRLDLDEAVASAP